MDRRLIFPAVAITAWAQQPAQPPGAGGAESALRARVDEFYKLQVEKKFRQGESYVADDTKDDYYNAGKPDIKGFEVLSLEMLDNDTRARVTVRRKMVVRNAQIGAMDFDLPVVTTWKIENGQWVYYIDHTVSRPSPFGPIAPAGDATKGKAGDTPRAGKIDLAQLMNQVTIDRTSVILSSQDPLQTVTVTNNLPGAVTLEVKRAQVEGVTAELDKTELKFGEKAVLQLRRAGDTKASGVIQLTVSPLNQTLDIAVQSK
jgi:hypothetical protein